MIEISIPTFIAWSALAVIAALAVIKLIEIVAMRSLKKADLSEVIGEFPYFHGLARIGIERVRQVSDEEWSFEHDDDHTGGSLAVAAGCYVLLADAYPNAGEPPPEWPWDDAWWKPKDYERDLVRAGALVAAEIDRLERQKGEA